MRQVFDRDGSGRDDEGDFRFSPNPDAGRACYYLANGSVRHRSPSILNLNHPTGEARSDARSAIGGTTRVAKPVRHQGVQQSMTHLALIACSIFAQVPAQEPASSSPRVHKIAVGGEGGWDYLTGRLRGAAALRLARQSGHRARPRHGSRRRRVGRHARRPRHRGRAGARQGVHQQRPR